MRLVQGGRLDIGIIFSNALPDDSNVQSRLRFTGPSGVTSEAGHHILEDKMYQSGRGGGCSVGKNQQDRPVGPQPTLTRYVKQAV